MKTIIPTDFLNFDVEFCETFIVKYFERFGITDHNTLNKAMKMLIEECLIGILEEMVEQGCLEKVDADQWRLTVTNTEELSAHMKEINNFQENREPMYLEDFFHKHQQEFMSKAAENANT